MGRHGKKTGSDALGRELRRLRGERTLAQIVALSRSEPFAWRCRPLSSPSLCQVESGTVLPTFDTLYTLAAVYQVSTNEFIELIVHERQTKHLTLPTTLAETKVRYAAAFMASHWYDAMAIALHGEQSADSEAERIRWRANKASCMAEVGLRAEAIDILSDCAHDPETAPEHRPLIYRNLATTLASAGYHVPAAEYARRALGMLPADAPGGHRAPFLGTRIRLLLLGHEYGTDDSPESLREALRLIETARQHVADEPQYLMLLDIQEAMANGYLGHDVIAARDLAAVAARARTAGMSGVEFVAWAKLGGLRKRQGKLEAAKGHLETAEQLAIDLKQVDDTFEISFQLYLIAEERGDAAKARYFKRCQRHFPMVRTRTPSVRQFARLVRGRQ